MQKVLPELPTGPSDHRAVLRESAQKLFFPGKTLLAESHTASLLCAGLRRGLPRGLKNELIQLLRRHVIGRGYILKDAGGLLDSP